MEILKDNNSGNYVKNQNPYEIYKEKEIKNDIITLYMQYNHLKNLYRQGFLKVRLGLEYKDKCESVADHSWSLAMLAMTMIEKYKLELDLNKCMKLAIVHELGEVYTGDYTPIDHMDPDEKHSMERENIKKVLEMTEFETDFLALWEEFEGLKTPESIFMKELDKLEFIMQCACYEIDISYLKWSRSRITNPIFQEIIEELIQLTEGKKIPKNVVEGNLDV